MKFFMKSGLIAMVAIAIMAVSRRAADPDKVKAAIALSLSMVPDKAAVVDPFSPKNAKDGCGADDCTCANCKARAKATAAPKIGDVDADGYTYRWSDDWQAYGWWKRKAATMTAPVRSGCSGGCPAGCSCPGTVGGGCDCGTRTSSMSAPQTFSAPRFFVRGGSSAACST